MPWIRRHLALRQTAYAVAAVAVLASAITATETFLAFQAEHDRVRDFAGQLADAFLDTSTRAAFHIDQAQAEAVLDGLINFETVAEARISTDLGELLAERTRTHQEGYLDPISRWLFSDVADHSSILASSTTHVPVGTLVFRISPEAVGRGFVSTLGPMIAGLLFEFLVLASVLAAIFHRTLIRPLITYARDIEDIDHGASEIQSLKVPRGHEIDELGHVVTQTNALLARISDQREALIHSEKIAALGSMLAGAAHELNNPLAVVTAQAQMLKEESQDEKITARANKILRPAERCAKIVKSFLGLVRQKKTDKAPAVIATVIQDAVDLVEYRLKVRDVDLQVSVAENIPVLAIDATQLSQAIVNLLINAEQAMTDQPPPRSIDLSVRLEGMSLIMSVSDNGPGIPAEYRDRVTEPFFTTKPVGHGTGLGLTYCSNVAASHHGTLKIEDRTPRGIVATLRIEAEPAELPEVEARILDPSTTRLSVLVVDDEESLTESFAEALKIRGHDVDTGFRASAALKNLGSKSYDVIVADIRMPGVGGLELMERAEQLRSGLSDRFIFVTGEPLTDVVATLLEESQTPCLFKPVDLNKLATAVEDRGLAIRARS